MHVVDLWFMHHAGEGRHLPISGGLAEQPAGLMTAWMMLDMFRQERLKDGREGDD